MSSPESIVIRRIEAELDGIVNTRRDVVAARLTTFGLGGSAALVISPETLTELAAVLKVLQDERQPYRILGAGSNVLFPDSGVEEPIVRLGKAFQQCGLLPDSTFGEHEVVTTLTGTMEHIDARLVAEEGRCDVVALGAVPLMKLCRDTVAAGLSGLEFAAGIPASVGGAVQMNAGAHGAEISNTLQAVAVLSPDSGFQVLNKDSLGLSYRHSTLPPDSLVVAAYLLLAPADAEAIAKKKNDSLQYRKETQPLHLPSAGSVFKNPSEGPAAAEMLEAVGLKGTRIGGVAFSEQHANWLVRVSDDAKAQDALELIALAKSKVAREYNCQLEQEIICW